MKQFRFFTIAMTLMAVFTTLGLAACGDDDEDSGEKTFYCTLKYEYPDDVSRSNITGMAIYITNPEGTETGFSAYNGEDWRTIFYTGEWSFRVRAKGKDNNGETVYLSGTTGSMKLTKEIDIPIKLYKE